MASQAVGIAEGAIDLAVAYAKERVQFKKPISANQGIQWYFADIATSTEAAKMLTLQALISDSADRISASWLQCQILCIRKCCYS